MPTADSLSDLASVFHALGRYAEAEPLHRRALAIREKARGQEHFDVSISLTNLGNALKAQLRYAEAEPLYRRALAIDEKALRIPNIPTTALDLYGPC